MTDNYEPKPIFQQASEFRSFCWEKWYEHKDELLIWEKKFPEYDSTYYFRKHRWLLKRMFKEHLIEEYMKNNERRLTKEVNRALKRGKKK